MDLTGVIIEESLADPSVLKRVRIVKTSVYPVNERHQTPWLERWTMHDVEVPAADARGIADELARSFDTSHPGAWYADFKNDREHFIAFPGRVFHVARENADEGYADVVRYGISVGIPDYQLDFARMPPAPE